MRSTTRTRRSAGFTLIEVLVALAIASGALLLLLSANSASLRKSVKARLSEQLERAAESKLAEWSAGIERASEGTLPGFPLYRWELRSAREESSTLRKLRRVVLRVSGPDAAAFEWSLLRYAGEGP